jgi:hypothetical protein
MTTALLIEQLHRKVVSEGVQHSYCVVNLRMKNANENSLKSSTYFDFAQGFPMVPSSPQDILVV